MMEVHICSRNGALLRAFALGDTEEVIIGRDDGCDIRINSQAVSREHCCIEQDGETFFLRDLDSTAGTIVEGNRIERIPLTHGLSAEIGPAILKFFHGEI